MMTTTNKVSWVTLQELFKIKNWTEQDEGLFKQIMEEHPEWLDEKNGEGETPLMLAIKTEQKIEIVKEILKRGVRVNVKDFMGWTPLILAATLDNNEYLKELMRPEWNVDIHAQCKDGSTALMWAARMKRVNNVNDLIQAGAALNAQDEDGNTALMMALLLKDKNEEEVIQRLIEAGADVNLRNNARETVLMWASMRSKPESLINLLIKNGALLNAQCKNGLTALIYAAIKSPSLIKPLIEAGADLEIRTLRGWTALMQAACEGRWDGVQALVEAGADQKAVNLLGQTFKEVALEFQRHNAGRTPCFERLKAFEERKTLNNVLHNERVDEKLAVKRL